MLLSDTRIRSAKPADKPYRLNDGDGLQLIIRPNGGKFWQFRYHYAAREKTISFGKYPVVSLSDARARRIEARKQIDSGANPSAERKQQRNQLIHEERSTLLAVASEWFERNEESWSPKHASKTWGRLKNHLLAELGPLPISGIKPLELLDTIRKIEGKGMTEMSRRVLQLSGSIFNYAIITGRAEYNITIGLSKALKPHREKHYPTLNGAELPEFLGALDRLPTSEQNRLAFRLLISTALRTGELRHSRWVEVDFQRREWRIPAVNTKMRTEHIVPLSRQTLEILTNLRRITGQGEWLFPNQQRRVHAVMSENTINKMIDGMGYKGRIVGHGFRSLFSTILNEQGFNRDAIERQLAHMERNRVRAAYNRAEYMEQRREIMQWWSDYLDQKKMAGLSLRSQSIA